MSELQNNQARVNFNPTTKMSKIIEKIKKWWRKHICSPVPPGQEDMFDEWNPKD